MKLHSKYPKMFYKDNWLKWSYNKLEYSSKKLNTDKFSLQIKKIKIHDIRNFDAELKSNAKKIYENNKKLTLFFSGGVNSQIILNTYLDLKIPIEVVIIKLSEYNKKEFSIAKSICEKLNVAFKVLHVDLDYFFENDALLYFKKNYTCDPYKLLLLRSSELVDGVPIIGNKFPYIYRSSFNYTEKSEWYIRFSVEDFVFQSFSNRYLVGDWFHYSPEVILSLLTEEFVDNLINDRIIGKWSILSSRATICNSHWKMFINRDKNNGIDDVIVPDSVIKFFNENIKETILPTELLDYKVADFRSQIFL